MAVRTRKAAILASAALTAFLGMSGWAGAGAASAAGTDNAPRSGVAAADPPITPGAGYQVFTWFGGGMPLNFEGPFTYAAAAPSVITVTDAFCKGDVFRVFDNGNPIGDTSTVAAPATCPPGSGNPGDTNNPDVAVHDTGYSHGHFLVPAGNHAITIQTIGNPFGAGGAFLRIDTCTVFTPDGSGIFTGTSGADVICGTAGADKVSGLGGDDLIFGFAGDDQISAGDGNDTVFAGAGNDKLAGGTGNDVLDGQEGDDQVAGTDGDDSLYGGVGTNQLSGGPGTDLCRYGTPASCELP